MKLWIGRIAVALMLIIVGWFAGTHSKVVHAQQPVSIPKAFGHCVGVMGPMLVFEGEDGTVRIVSPENGQLQMMMGRN
jgi:hypothetical protein